jgi:preprotein translocase subunit SecF
MNIVKLRKIWYLISLVLILPGIMALFFWGLKPGLDFKGGTLMEVQFTNSTDKNTLETGLKDLNLENLAVQTSGQNTYILRTAPLSQEQKGKLSEAISKIGESKELRFETVGPTVSNDLKKKATIAIILASLAIIFYIAFAFRQVPRPASSWRFGVCAVIALVHDLAFVTGVFAILGHYFNYEVDSLFITALLTIMGFSVHDTIVVFDRIRENLRKHPSSSFETNVNDSILQTINRSLNTSLTVLIVLAAMYFLGGTSLKHFVLALLIGIAIGTYSSIFNAAQLLVSWQGWTLRRLAKKNAS